MPFVTDDLTSTYFKLYDKAKRLHWDPADIDLAVDRAQWAEIKRDYPVQRYGEQIHRLCALFAAGEESVANTLAPFLAAIPRGELGLDKEFHLAAQLYEEAKHYEFFARYFTEVFGESPELALRELTPAPQALLIDDLDAVTNRLRLADGRVEVRRVFLEAVTHYMGTVEAMLARTGYVGAHEALATRGWLPGLQEGFRLIRRDEGRHVAFGIQVVRELCANDPAMQQIVQDAFERNLPNVLGTIQTFGEYEYPIVDLGKLIAFALGSYQQFMASAGLAEAPEDQREFEAELAG
ncbi:MAG: ribonucleotide-diphosphate reductase subunit beta [Gemmatimonadaceae bacterium]|nr:ribonucleotide-diphosphate reductase subunit beta [Gemmatimonadaceae bacterium]